MHIMGLSSIQVHIQDSNLSIINIIDAQDLINIEIRFLAPP